MSVRTCTARVCLFLLLGQSCLMAEAEVGEQVCTTLETCQTYGTAISWMPNLESAQKLARQQSKLLFVVQLSGNFTNETFT